MRLPVMASFDDADLHYMVTAFDKEALRVELKHAEIEQGVAMCWGRDNDIVYWREYGKLCRLALEEHRKRQPPLPEGKFSARAVKERNDIIEVIGRYTDLRNGGREHKGSCPFHEDRNPSLQVNGDKQKFYCFSCGRRGDVIDFVREIENLSMDGACRFLSGHCVNRIGGES